MINITIFYYCALVNMEFLFKEKELKPFKIIFLQKKYQYYALYIDKIAVLPALNRLF